MDKVELTEEIFKLCRTAYIQGHDDGVHGWSYDFDDIDFLTRINFLIGASNESNL